MTLSNGALALNKFQWRNEQKKINTRFSVVKSTRFAYFRECKLSTEAAKQHEKYVFWVYTVESIFTQYCPSKPNYEIWNSAVQNALKKRMTGRYCFSWSRHILSKCTCTVSASRTIALWTWVQGHTRNNKSSFHVLFLLFSGQRKGGHTPLKYSEDPCEMTKDKKLVWYKISTIISATFHPPLF